jgi:hypothetical protein
LVDTEVSANLGAAIIQTMERAIPVGVQWDSFSVATTPSPFFRFDTSGSGIDDGHLNALYFDPVVTGESPDTTPPSAELGWGGDKTAISPSQRTDGYTGNDEAQSELFNYLNDIKNQIYQWVLETQIRPYDEPVEALIESWIDEPFQIYRPPSGGESIRVVSLTETVYAAWHENGYTASVNFSFVNVRLPNGADVSAPFTSGVTTATEAPIIQCDGEWMLIWRVYGGGTLEEILFYNVSSSGLGLVDRLEAPHHGIGRNQLVLFHLGKKIFFGLSTLTPGSLDSQSIETRKFNRGGTLESTTILPQPSTGSNRDFYGFASIDDDNGNIYVPVLQTSSPFSSTSYRVEVYRSTSGNFVGNFGGRSFRTGGPTAWYGDEERSKIGLPQLAICGDNVLVTAMVPIAAAPMTQEQVVWSMSRDYPEEPSPSTRTIYERIVGTIEAALNVNTIREWHMVSVETDATYVGRRYIVGPVVDPPLFDGNVNFRFTAEPIVGQVNVKATQRRDTLAIHKDDLLRERLRDFNGRTSLR